MRERMSSLALPIAGVGVVLLLAALLIRWLAVGPQWLPTALAIGGVILVVLYPILRPQEVLGALRARQTQAGANAVLMSAAFIGILAVINFLGYRYHKRIDLTANKQFTLSEQTVALLKGLEEPVHALAFFSETDLRRDTVEDLLREYALVTGKFTYEFVNLNREPGKARQYNISRPGVVLLLRGDRREEVTVFDEEDLTSGLIKVTRDKPKVVYFTTGHGEHEPNAFQESGYSRAIRVLEREFYEVKTINLTTITDTLPSDMAALVIAGPRQPLIPEELDRVFTYLDEGGRVLLMIDPDPGFDIAGLNERLQNWGVRYRNDLVVDPPSSFLGDIVSPLVNRYTFHTITKSLAGLTTFFPTSRSIEEIDPTPEGKTVTPLIRTSPNSWGETNLQSLQVRYDEGQDTRGPLNLAVVVQMTGGEEEKRGRLVVVGDSDFPSNALLNSVAGAFGNAELLSNMINWLTEEEALVAIGPKPPEFRPLRPLTPGERNVIFFTSTILLPLIILGAGITIWWQRR